MVAAAQGRVPENKDDRGTRCIPDPALSKERLSAGSKWRLKARRGFITDPNEGVSRREALGQVKTGRLYGPYKLGERGWLATADGPQ